MGWGHPTPAPARLNGFSSSPSPCGYARCRCQTKRFGRRIIRLAVECKNLHDNNPLLVSCLPRADEESFHTVAYSVNPNRGARAGAMFRSFTTSPQPRARSVPLGGDFSIYKPNEPVGKATDQVGRTIDGAFVSARWPSVPKATSLARRANTIPKRISW